MALPDNSFHLATSLLAISALTLRLKSPFSAKGTTVFKYHFLELEPDPYIEVAEHAVKVIEQMKWDTG
jgi:hypothetical protein